MAGSELNWGCVFLGFSPAISTKTNKQSVQLLYVKKNKRQNALDIPQLEQQAYMLGAAFPTLPSYHWEVPGRY